ncbi:MAG: hypothetical protein ABI741_07850 [Ferruginibacter sp.]
MKKNIALLFAFPLISLLFIKCAKTAQVNDTQLLVTLKDTSGNFVQGVTVRLYKSAADSGITQISDAAGIVLFPNLEAVTYYWLAEKGCQNNRNSQITIGRPLVLGTVGYGFSILSGTGILKITNNSGEPYIVSDSLFNIILNDTPYIAYPTVGSYLIHSEKQSAPGTGSDSLVQVSCGDTSFLDLP